jgi:hypothetical protein
MMAVTPGTVHPSAARQHFPAAQLTGNIARLQLPVLHDGDRSDRTRAQAAHLVKCSFVGPADRFLTPDHLRSPTPHDPFR